LGEGADEVSALNLMREAAPRAMVKQAYSIRGGSDTLPKAFAARLGGRIHYGVAVVKIEHDARGVRVACSLAGTPTTFAADYLICAIPFAVLRRVTISPDFSSIKQQAITQLGNTSVVRVFLPRSSVSSTGHSSHILIRCSTRRSTIRRTTDFNSSACGMLPK